MQSGYSAQLVTKLDMHRLWRNVRKAPVGLVAPAKLTFKAKADEVVYREPRMQVRKVLIRPAGLRQNMPGSQPRPQ